jgi:hypothetical protein
MDTTQSLVEIIFLLSVATILEAIAIGLLLRRLRYATRPIRVVALQAYPVYVPYPVGEAAPAEPTEPPAEWDPVNDPDGWKNRPAS